MAIKPPAWCSRAVPVPAGWKHWTTNEILLPKKFTEEQIAEFWAEKEGAPASAAPEPELIDEAVHDMITEGKIEAAMAASELETMTKKELEELGREHGLELDRRLTKKSLVEQMKDVIPSKQEQSPIEENMIKLTEENLYLYAAKHYYNPKYIDAEEFQEDLKRFKYIKRLLNRYQETGKLSERLILNHLIVVFNVFGIEAGLNILKLKLLDKHWYLINPFLVFLKAVDGDPEMDPTIVNALRKI